MSSNLNGRDYADKNRKKAITKLLKCKKTYIVSVMNVRTLRNEIAQKELIANFTKNELDIFGIVDHKIVHENHIKFYEKQNSTLITTSIDRNSINAATGGLGLMLNTSLANA